MGRRKKNGKKGERRKERRGKGGKKNIERERKREKWKVKGEGGKKICQVEKVLSIRLAKQMIQTDRQTYRWAGMQADRYHPFQKFYSCSSNPDILSYFLLLLADDFYLSLYMSQACREGIVR